MRVADQRVLAGLFFRLTRTSWLLEGGLPELLRKDGLIVIRGEETLPAAAPAGGEEMMAA